MELATRTAVWRRELTGWILASRASSTGFVYAHPVGEAQITFVRGSLVAVTS